MTALLGSKFSYLTLLLCCYSSIVQASPDSKKENFSNNLDSDVSIKGTCNNPTFCHQSYNINLTFEDFIKKPIKGGTISSPYGWRNHPISARKKLHAGVDYAIPIGTKVAAAEHGKVVFVGKQRGYGNIIIIKHNDKYRTAYGHLNNFDENIKVGSWVNKGQVIAYSGNTGASTGPHLHFEIRQHGKAIDPLMGDHEVRLASSKTNDIHIKGRLTQKQENGRIRTIVTK